MPSRPTLEKFLIFTVLSRPSLEKFPIVFIKIRPLFLSPSARMSTPKF
jgi:hypothetical protein